MGTGDCRRLESHHNSHTDSPQNPTTTELAVHLCLLPAPRVVFQPILARDTRRRVRDGQESFRWNPGAALGADTVFTNVQTGQCDTEVPGLFHQTRGDELLLLLTLEALRDIKEISAANLGAQRLGLPVESSLDAIELHLQLMPEFVILSGTRDYADFVKHGCCPHAA